MITVTLLNDGKFIYRLKDNIKPIPCKNPMQTLDLLLCFLQYESRRNTAYILDIFWNKDFESHGGNVYELRRIKNNNFIIRSYIYESKYRFKTSSENMKKILEDWKGLMDMNPQPDEIVVTQEDEKVTFEPIFYK